MARLEQLFIEEKFHPLALEVRTTTHRITQDSSEQRTTTKKQNV